MNKFTIILNRIMNELEIHEKCEMIYDMSNIHITEGMLDTLDLSSIFYYAIKNPNTVSKLNLKKINQIFLIYTKDYIIEFLKKGDLYQIFEKNLTVSNCMKKYFEYLFNQGYSPFAFITCAFSWERTVLGHTYWCNIHRIFINFLLDKLYHE